MSYEFPIIRTLDDVLPHIEGCDEFIVAEREFGTVVNYMVIGPDTFPPIKVAGGSAKMREQRSLANRIRRECRGLIFGLDGKLMSRPFHKFFNINEREETQVQNVDWTRPHAIVEKMDGSMVRPILDKNGKLRLATKMGLSEVAEAAEKYLRSRDDFAEVSEWLIYCVKEGFTPLFEYIAPDNQIVINYDEPDLVLLAIRHNETGDYHDDWPAAPDTITRVPVIGSMSGDINDYIERARMQKDREGDIICFANGEMYKSKNDWYVRIHKTLDMIRFDRNIVDLILNEDLDDVVPMLPLAEANRVRAYEAKFWTAFNDTKVRLARLVAEAGAFGNRKEVATKYVPKLEDKNDAQFIFRGLDGYSLHDQLLTHIGKSIGSNVKWEQCERWLGIK